MSCISSASVVNFLLFYAACIFKYEHNFSFFLTKRNTAEKMTLCSFNKILTLLDDIPLLFRLWKPRRVDNSYISQNDLLRARSGQGRIYGKQQNRVEKAGDRGNLSALKTVVTVAYETMVSDIIHTR